MFVIRLGKLLSPCGYCVEAKFVVILAEVVFLGRRHKRNKFALETKPERLTRSISPVTLPEHSFDVNI